MPGRHFQITVGTTAGAIEGSQFPGWLMVNNGSETVFIGDSAVTDADGFPVAAGETFPPHGIELPHRGLRGLAQDRLYGITTTSTSDVRVVIYGRTGI